MSEDVELKSIEVAIFVVPSVSLLREYVSLYSDETLIRHHSTTVRIGINVIIRSPICVIVCHYSVPSSLSHRLFVLQNGYFCNVLV